MSSNAGRTCYEQDEKFCEEQWCLGNGCRLENEKAAKRPSDRLSAEQIERAAEALRAYEYQHSLVGFAPWGNLNEKIKQHFRGKVRVVVDSIEVAE